MMGARSFIGKSAVTVAVQGHRPMTDPERRERLAYLADMLGELETMAARDGCATLAGLLGVAQDEAIRQSDLD